MQYLLPADFQDLKPYLLLFLQDLVQIESPTTFKEAVDSLGQRIAHEMRGLGAEVKQHKRDKVGDHWSAIWGEGEKQITMLAHMDTVHPVGTLDQLPWEVKGDRIYGPGVLDMKASIAIACTAIQGLLSSKQFPNRRICLLCTSDEETGSHHSQDLIRTLALKSELVLCLEPALPNGSLKTWRKGVGIYRLSVQGKPAHAGANPEDGINAIVEMSHLIQQIQSFPNEEAGTTLNVGLIRGGTRSNVVPAQSSIVVDIRVENEAEQSRISQAMSHLQTSNPEAQLEIEGEWNRPPMPRTQAMIQTFEKAKATASEIGLEISEGGTGGGSDANFVAPLGIPVLDGLGAIGGGAHTLEEYIELDSLMDRTALLAAILTGW
jgi:glutamate carboxypeptidase